VLVIDELGFQALDRRDAHLLFKALSSHYERASTIITSNTAIREWPEKIAGDELLATVILDRLLPHCHVVQIDGRSFQLFEVQTMGNEERGVPLERHAGRGIASGCDAEVARGQAGDRDERGALRCSQARSARLASAPRPPAQGATGKEKPSSTTLPAQRHRWETSCGNLGVP